MKPPVTLPRYQFWVLVLAAILGPIGSIYFSVQVANNNSEQLISRYQADRARSAAANQTVYCVLFGSQLDAFKDAESSAGQASYRAWLAVYKLVQCQPIRK